MTRDRLLLPTEVAEWLRVEVDTLTHWRYRKTGPQHQPQGRRVLYRESDVQAWLDAQQQKAAS